MVIIVIIDKIDKSINNQLFLDFIGMLRNKYLLRNEGQDHTFQSVILAGVHDVKSLKVKVRPEVKYKYNSPWNIAFNFNIDMSFSKHEIMAMLDNYSTDSNGYPFLMRKLRRELSGKRNIWIRQ